MTDVWIPRLLVIGQVVAMGVLGALVACGHDSAISDALLAIAGSLSGASLLSKVKGKAITPSD
jgi:outer membrane lipoprotein SlyB